MIFHKHAIRGCKCQKPEGQEDQFGEGGGPLERCERQRLARGIELAVVIDPGICNLPHAVHTPNDEIFRDVRLPKRQDSSVQILKAWMWEHP